MKTKKIAKLVKPFGAKYLKRAADAGRRALSRTETHTKAPQDIDADR